MQRDIATILLQIGAVSLRTDPPFTWASGRFSPIYCDNRLIMSHPRHRAEVATGFKNLLAEQNWRPEVVAGTATAGIPHAAWLAQLLDLPMVYVRGAAKGHGKQNRVEGRLEKGQRVVLIEDLISTGGSSVGAAQPLIDAEAELLGIAAIFTYGLDVADRRFAEAKIPWVSLTTFEKLLTVALSEEKISASEKAILADWQKDPAQWSLARGGAG